MRKVYVVILLLSWLLAGCGLAGDITPPPELATSQSAQSLTEPINSPLPTPTVVSEVVSNLSPSSERGASIYFEQCASCHGEGGLGDGVQADALPHTPSPIGDPEYARLKTPLEWFEIVTNGKVENSMPGFESLSEAERWDVVAYAFSLNSKPMDALFGEEIYAGLCSDCHGPGGEGSESVPSLLDPQWIVRRSKEDLVETIGKGVQPGMPAFSETLSEKERDALAEFIFDLSFPGAEQHALDEEAKLDGDASEDQIMVGVIRGQITNGSQGGDLPESIQVTLYGFDDQQEAFSESTIAGESGEYQFSEVAIQPDRVFVATVEYQGAVYASEITHITADAELDLPITIFESTADVSDVRVDRMHVIIDMPSEGVLQITELWILSNLGDRTIASDSGDGVFSVQLPEGAENLGFESGMVGTRFQITEDGFIDLFPIRPGMGSHEIVFSFNMPISKSLDFSQPLDYSVDAVVILTPDGIVELNGEGVQDLGLRQMAGSTLRNYNTGPIPSGGVLTFTIERAAGSEMASEGTISAIEIGVAVVIFVAALGGTGFWLYRRKRQAEVGLGEFPWSEEPTTDLDALDDRDEVFQALADLDDAYEAREIERVLYQERRKDLKSHLVEIMKQEEDD